MKSIDCYSHFAGNPFFNMAFDDWIAHFISETEGAVVLRLYTWKTPAITFGFHQDARRAFNQELLEGTPTIRRVTGGRALLHDPSELTYAIGINLAQSSLDSRFASISSASESIGEALVEFLGAIGRESQYLRVSSVDNSRPDFFQSAPCFASSARYEVVAEGQKLIASAQRRLPNGLFQHGSIKINGLSKHPALNGEASTNVLKPVTAEQFISFVGLFFQTFSDRLELKRMDVSCTGQMKDWVAKRQQQIQMDSCAQSDAVKQEE